MPDVVSLVLALPILLGGEAGIRVAPPPSFTETLSVTATARERRAIDIPYVIETLDRGDYALQQHRTLPEAMRFLASVRFGLRTPSSLMSKGDSHGKGREPTSKVLA